jgi:hypothetical protein
MRNNAAETRFGGLQRWIIGSCGSEYLYSITIIMVIVVTMPTTVQVNEKTLQMLNDVKKEMKAKSHDEVIKALISERKKIPCSMFGSNRKLSSFTEQDEAEFHEL